MSDIFKKIENTMKRMGLTAFQMNWDHTREQPDLITVSIKAHVRKDEVDDIDDLDYRIKRLQDTVEGASFQANKWCRQREVLALRISTLNVELGDAQREVAKLRRRLEQVQEVLSPPEKPACFTADECPVPFDPELED